MFSTRCNLVVRNILGAHIVGSSADAGCSAAGICTSSICGSNNYYESLGIPKNSTQTDIKAAYYKLSMIFHPDKNQGSTSAANKFREITQAYEVLGNYRLRRLYDKGIIHTAGAQYAHREEAEDDISEVVPDDPETKFYKSRFKKSKVADIHGRTPIYDFDEWSRAHYADSFQRRTSAKEKFERQEVKKKTDAKTVQNEILIFGMVFCISIGYAVFYAESSYDAPAAISKRDTEAKAKQNT